MKKSSSHRPKKRNFKRRHPQERNSHKGNYQKRSSHVSNAKNNAGSGTPIQGCFYCSRAKQCGACPEITTPYPEQLQAKQDYLTDLFKDLYASDTHIYALAGMDNPTHYRNKVISPFACAKGATKTSNPEILTGMYARGTHRLINTDNCLVENETANKIVQAIRALMIKYHMEPYNEDTGEGFMRHVVIRVGHTSNEVLVTLVTNKEEFKGAKNFCRELVARVPAITTIVQNVNTRQTNVILGDKLERTLYGPGFILDTLCGVSFRISSHSFYQVNASQTEVLYHRALEMAHLSAGDCIIDAYCGTGTIGLAAAALYQAHLFGVDSVAAAIRDAQENARHNGILSAEFICADAGDYLQELAHHQQTVDVVFMDPPRAGSSKDFLEALIALKPKRIVYISCNPKTQKRDAEILCDAGYTITEAQGVDMFPHTDHIEHIITLEQKGAEAR